MVVLFGGIVFITGYGCYLAVCYLAVFRHVHLDPDVRVHRGTENSFIVIFAENASLRSYDSIATN